MDSLILGAIVQCISIFLLVSLKSWVGASFKQRIISLFKKTVRKKSDFNNVSLVIDDFKDIFCLLTLLTLMFRIKIIFL